VPLSKVAKPNMNNNQRSGGKKALPDISGLEGSCGRRVRIEE
jgi:hypothetical protein